MAAVKRNKPRPKILTLEEHEQLAHEQSIWLLRKRMERDAARKNKIIDGKLDKITSARLREWLQKG